MASITVTPVVIVDGGRVEIALRDLDDDWDVAEALALPLSLPHSLALPLCIPSSSSSSSGIVVTPAVIVGGWRVGMAVRDVGDGRDVTEALAFPLSLHHSLALPLCVPSSSSSPLSVAMAGVAVTTMAIIGGARVGTVLWDLGDGRDILSPF